MFEISTGSLLNSKELQSGNIPRISAKSDNNGVIGYYDTKYNKNARHFENFISINFFGDCFYHPYLASIEMKVHILKLKNHIFTKRSGIFIISILHRVFKNRFTYGAQLSSSKLKNDDFYILLPIKNGDIDFEFMESFVAELEAERVAELEAYLAAASLKDYELTTAELSALSKFENYNWGEFRIGDLFIRLNTKKLPYKAKNLPTNIQNEFNLPCLTSSFNNQGLNYFAPRAGATILKNVISLPSNSDVYRGYFQSRDFTVLSDAYVIDWTNKETKHKIQSYLFSLTSINKVTDLPIYSYKNKLGGWNVVRNKLIQLPINKDGEIDFEFMNDFIKAIEKLVIKDVVIYAEHKIQATKGVISSNI